MTTPKYTVGSYEETITEHGGHQPVPPVHAMRDGKPVHPVTKPLIPFEKIQWSEVATDDACGTCLDTLEKPHVGI